MITKIRKRDGREVTFDPDKISQAIFKAAVASGGTDYGKSAELASKVTNVLNTSMGDTIPTVEDIQDIVEKTLIENGHAQTAKAYILYRAERTKVREMNTKLMKTLEDLTFEDAKDNDMKRENANIDGNTAMGTMLKYGSESAKQFYNMFILNPEHSSAHQKGDIHIHDLDFLTLTTTCCQIDIKNLFEGGFSTGHGYLREPNSIQSYSALACIAIQANQNDQHGGQSIPNFDYAMADGVIKSYKKLYRQNFMKALELLFDGNYDETQISLVFDKIEDQYDLIPRLEDDKYLSKERQLVSKLFNNEKDVKRAQKFAKDRSLKEIDRMTYQAMEALIHNLNTMHSRAGAQIPFSSINYGTDTTPEGRLVVKNLLLAQEAGLGNGETPIFPIHIFKVKEGINYNSHDPNYDLFRLACRVSAKRLFPNFSFIDAPYNLQYYKEGRPETEISYMGCRTRVVANVHDKSQEIVNSRGNLSFTTINLPRLGLKHQNDISGFYRELDEKMDLVIEQLLDRLEIQSGKKVKNFPFLMGEGIWLDSEKLDLDDEIREVLKHGTLSVGFIGLAECLKALTGKHHGESEESQNLGLEIIGYMRTKLDKMSESLKLNLTLLATPAEGTAGRFVEMDREIYGSIPGITDREYYTNSFHIPVYYDISIFDKINLEAPYHAYTNAGHITYVELDGDPLDNLDAFEKIIRTMKEAGIGYGSINHPVDRDPVCGYTGIIGEYCPSCNREEDDIKFERVRRITGYLVGTIDRFNNAKKAEVQDRVSHSSMKRNI